jgi:hypothetical protein
MEAVLTITAKDLAKGAVQQTATGFKSLGKSAIKASEDIKKMAKAAEEVGKSFKEVASKAAEMTAKIMAGAAAATYAFKKLFVDVAIQAEDCGRLMSAAFGESLGAEAMKTVRAFSEQTGLALQDVTQAYLSLGRNGIQPTEDHIRALADLAAANGKSIADVGKSFEGLLKGQAGGLEEFGVKSEQVGNRLLISYKNRQGEMVNLAAKANDPANLAKIMAQISQDKAGGAEAERGKTFSGMISRMAAGWTEFRTLVMDSGPFAYLKEQLAGVLEWVEKLKGDGTLQKMAAEWGEKITGALVKIRNSMRSVYDWVLKYKPAFASFFNSIGGFKTVAAGVATFMGGPLVAAIVKAGVAVKGLGAAMLTNPVGLVIAGGAAVVALMAKIGALQPFVDGLIAGFNSMKGVLGEAFTTLLKSLSGLFGEVTGSLVDVNGQVNPEAWKNLGDAIAVFTGGALADLLKGLAKAVGFLKDLGLGLGTAAGTAVFGDQQAVESQNMQNESYNKRIQLARANNNHEEANRLVAEAQAYNDNLRNEKPKPANQLSSGPGNKFQIRPGAFSHPDPVSEPQFSKYGYKGSPITGIQNKPQTVNTKVDVNISGTVQPGLDVKASSTDPNTTVSDKTKAAMGGI